MRQGDKDGRNTGEDVRNRRSKACCLCLVLVVSFILYGGTLPSGNAQEPFLLGDPRADFIELLLGYIECCEGSLKLSAENSVEQVHIHFLLSAYTKLHRLFKQMLSCRNWLSLWMFWSYSQGREKG